MGDRANLALRYADDRRIYVYTHWCGEDLHEMAQEAVKKALASGRLPHDETYAARIIFDSLTEHAAAYDTGWGLGLDTAGDAAHPLIEVNVMTGWVAIWDLDNTADRNPKFDGTPRWEGSAQDYVALDYDPRWQTSNEEEAAEA